MGKRVLLCGVGPLPDAQGEKLFAPGLRTWAMHRALFEAGHTVLVAEATFGENPGGGPTDPGADLEAARREFRRIDIRWQHTKIPLSPERAAPVLAELARTFRPEAIVTTTDVMALAVVQSGLPQPFYADYNGDPMAERQIMGWLHGNDAALADAWRTMLPVLLRADRFGACSGAQRAMLLGQLSAAGRLNSKTACQELVDSLPPGVGYESHLSPPGVYDLRADRNIPADAVIVLFTGGYNTWQDEETLFSAVEEAMVRDQRVHYVSTGGGLSGHSTKTFERFMARVDASRNRHRYHFLGWIESRRLADVIGQSTLAISLDIPCYEAEFGFRNRVNLWLELGLPCVTTPISEGVRILAEHYCVYAVPPRDPHRVADAILDLGRDPDRRRAFVVKAKAYLEEHGNAVKLLAPLAKWCNEPALAADRLAALGELRRADSAGSATRSDIPLRTTQQPLTDHDAKDLELVMPQNELTRAQSDFLRAEAALAEERAAREALESRLAQLEGSRVVQAYKKIFKK